MANLDHNVIKPLYDDKYYVYALCKPCGQVFYIGKGKGARINNHFAKWSLDKSNNKKNQTIRKYGNSIKREILCYFYSEDTAYEYEEWLISHYGLESEGGQLRQYAKTRNDYSEEFAKKASKNSRMKTDNKTEELVSTAYKMYFTDKISKHHIAKDLNIKYSTLNAWLKGNKHKVLYKKYILSNKIQINREFGCEFKLSKKYDIDKMKTIRERWVNGESTGVLAKEVGITTATLKDLLVGNSARGLFDDYSTFPERYLKRKNKGKWLEDKIS